MRGSISSSESSCKPRSDLELLRQFAPFEPMAVGVTRNGLPPAEALVHFLTNTRANRVLDGFPSPFHSLSSSDLEQTVSSCRCGVYWSRVGHREVWFNLSLFQFPARIITGVSINSFGICPCFSWD